MNRGKPEPSPDYLESVRKKKRQRKIEEFAGWALTGMPHLSAISIAPMSAEAVAEKCVDLAEAMVAEIERRANGDG